ncbi:MAG: PLP-dependent aminotransferase family protein [Acidobacteriota bacterium]|nr:MAG: PLP-dependent aminotransferase family protein [Acidobacteriota bacterium]
MSWKLSIAEDSPTPVHVQIRRGIREAVRSGALRPGERLTGVRPLAEELGVNRLTVLKAIRALTRSGLLTTVRGKGVFVSRRPHGLDSELALACELEGPFFEGVAEGPGESESARSAVADGIKSTLDDALSSEHLAFSAGFPPPEAIPTDSIRRRLNKILRSAGGWGALSYISTEGDPRLHDALRAVLRERGLVLGDDDRILTTSGAQQGIQLSLQALLQPGEAMALESPGYMGAIAACRLMRVPMIPVPVDQSGLNPERLETALKKNDVGLIYTVPNFQNPTGVTQSHRRREQILDLAVRHDALIVEDDIYADLRLGGRRIPPLKSFAGGERVVYVGSFSKSLAPGLRIGFLVAHVSLADKLRRVKEISDINTGGLVQSLLADLIGSGFYRRHLVRIKRQYRERRDAMIAALEACFPPSVRFTRPRGGLHLWVMPSRRLDASSLNERARREGVSFSPGALFFCDERRSSSFRINNSSHPPDRIDQGMQRLARCLEQEVRS